VELQQNPLQVPPVDPKADPNLQAFVETYFSNYIEGTEFEIKEAHDIVVNGRPMKYRRMIHTNILGTTGDPQVEAVADRSCELRGFPEATPGVEPAGHRVTTG